MALMRLEETVRDVAARSGPLMAVGRWLLALAAPGAALGLSLLLDPLIEQIPAPPFMAAVLIVAGAGGFRPALLTVALSVVALDYVFLAPVHSVGLTPADAWWLLLFGAVSVGTAWVIASRRAVQGRLAASEQQLRLVTDAAPVLIYYVDAGGRYRFANRPYAERCGRTPEDIVGRSVSEVSGPERCAGLEGSLAAALAGRPTTFDVTCAGEDGPRHLVATYVPDPGPRGRVRGVVAVINDITDRKQADDERVRLLALEQSRRREAEAIAELGRILTQGLDLDAVAQRIAELARGLLRAVSTIVYRVDPGSRDFVCQAISGDMGPFRPGGVLPRGAGAVGRAVERGRPVTSANVLDDPDIDVPQSTREWIEQAPHRAALAVPLRVKGRVIGAFSAGDRPGRVFGPDEVRLAEALADHAAVALDNARLFAGEQAARGEAEARAQRARLLADVSRALASSLDYEATLDAVAHLVVPARADWCVVHLARRDGAVRRVAAACADPAHAALAAETVRLAPTVDWLRDVSPTLQSVRAGRSLLVAQTTAARIEEIVNDPGDRRIVLALQPRSMLVVPLVARGRALGSIAWLRIGGPEPYTADDLSLAEDIAARAALAVDNARLYRRAERARGEAESANQAKDEFLAVLSHELRTPLTSMLGWLRLLRTGQLGAERVAQALEVVERNTRTQAQLINDLLDVSRIVAGKLQLDLYPVDLTPIMEETVESARRDAEAKGVALELTVSAAAGPVLGDPLRLGQIVANLVANAVKFTPAGGRVRVGLARHGAEAVVTVTDTGIGIPPEMLAHVFDRFRQADSTITRRHGGLGLGLAIVRHLAELHGGTVRAESRGDGQGATFTVGLPIAAPEGRRGRGEVAVAPGTPPAGPRVLADVRVLVVEDRPDTAELLRAALAGQGARVRVAVSLAEALEALAGTGVDVLVSDIAMPDGNGYELLRRLRERERATGRAPLPAVAVTAFAGGEDSERARAAGFHHYVAKPIDPAALVEVIARAAAR
jgi:PAS domain S-box-containing protein